MSTYIVLLVITAALSLPFGAVNSDANQKKKYLLLVGIVLTVVMGLRTMEVGTDSAQYYYAFFAIQEMPINQIVSTRYEPMYFLLNRIAGVVSSSPYSLFFIESTVTIFLFMRFIYKNSVNPLISVVLFQEAYFYCTAFNLSRAYLALSIALVGYEFIADRKCIAVVCVLIGALVHVSVFFVGLIYVLMYVLRNIKSGHLIVFGGVCISFGIFYRLVLEMLVVLMPRYQYYLVHDGGATSLGLFPIFLCILTFIGVILVESCPAKKQKLQLEEMNYCAVAIIIGAAISLMSGEAQAVHRLSQYGSIFLILFIPIIGVKTKYGNLFQATTVLFLTAYFIYMLSEGVAGVVPYQSWII